MSAPVADNAPSGFRWLDLGSVNDFSGRVVRIHGRIHESRLTCGFRVLPEHCNVAATCHGGLLATFCDMALAFGGMAQMTQPVTMLPTMSLSLDYLAPIRVGHWVEAVVDVLRIGRNACVAQSVLRVDGLPAVRAHGQFSIPSERHVPAGAPDTGAWLRRLLG